MISLIYQIIALPLTLLGAFVILKVIILPMRVPCDTSNRIAHFILVWFAVARPELFVGRFPFLTKDVLDIIKAVK